MNKKVIAVGLAIVVLIISVAAVSCFRKDPSTTVKASLTFYGLEDSDVWEPIIARYRQSHSNVTIKYKKFNDPATFENLVVDEIAEGAGPDIFYLHNTWLAHHAKKLVPLQSKKFTEKEFSNTFVNVTAKDFIQADPADGAKKIFALPLFVDTLALYYNKRDFEQKLPERGKPAPTWDLIKQDAEKFKQQDQTTKKLTHGEIALGRADNIKLAPELLYNLWLQAGVNFYDNDFKQVQLSGAASQYFDYFLSFADAKNKNYSWNTDLVTASSPSAELEAFLSGKVSSVMAYSSLYPRLDVEIKNVKARTAKAISKSDIEVVASPQVFADESKYKVWASYYGLGVSRNSKNAAVAWDFIQFATSKVNAISFHKATQLPAARRDLIEDQKKEPITDVFVSQVGYAGSFPIYSDQKFSEALVGAISSANGGQTASSALGGAKSRMNDLLKSEAPNGLYPKPPAKKK